MRSCDAALARKYELICAMFQEFCVATTWVVLSASLVFLNKFILTSTPFHFPLTLALLHMIACTCLCNWFFYLAPERQSKQADSAFDAKLAFQLVGISALFAVSLLCSNSALTRLDVATIQVLKSLNPPMIYLIGIWTGVEMISARTASILVAIGTGIVFSVRGSPQFHASGIALQTISIIADSTRYIRLQGLLQSKHLNLDSLNVLRVVAPSTAVILWIPASYLEFSEIFFAENSLKLALVWVVLSCTLACCLNITSNAFIRSTSALTMSVTGVIKDVCMIAISIVVGGADVSFEECAGFAITLAGSCAYNLSKIRRQKSCN